MTQTNLVVYLEINHGHISDLERGHREVSIIALQEIAKGVDMTMEELLRAL